LRVDEFDFELPEERIALRPVEPRDKARLLVVRPDAKPEFADRLFSDLPDLLDPADILVCNDTSVIRARLKGIRARDDGRAGIEVTLHKRVDAATWRAFAKPARRLRVGDRVSFGADERACLAGVLDGTIAAKGAGGEVTIAFDFSGPVLDEAIAAQGVMPLPPYIASRREPDARDETDYQTVFAREEGAVAASTAALHFTDGLIERLAERGIKTVFVTLHIGAGTFLPVKADDTAQHRMHAEWGTINEDTARQINRARAAGGRIVAAGTTALRLIEAAALPDGEVTAFAGETDLFITPGYRFKAVDRLITNFHLPRSTLFMLVCAFSGLARMRRAYAHAIAEGYRFYSYGDACLLYPEAAP
jgi:S-adenosylmethionine:tRNA ribosyltransferase-isomerase